MNEDNYIVIKENEKKDEIIYVQCVDCKTTTRHKILLSYDIHNNIGDIIIDSYQIIQCQGCMDINFRHLNLDIIDLEPNGRNIETETEKLYSERSEIQIKEIKEIKGISKNIDIIYRQTIKSFNNQLYILTAVGLRAIVEGLCVNLGFTKDVDKKKFSDLYGKINGLYEKGYLSKEFSEILHKLRFLGNKAVHELSEPSESELQLAIEIIEHILESVYIISQKGEELQNKINKRINKT